MKRVYGVEFKPGTKEELLPNYSPEFPCTTTRYAPLTQNSVPWHWHSAVELFYVDQGEVEYITPTQRHVFSAGSGGLVNTNMLHMTRTEPVPAGGAQQFLHLFDPTFISGGHGNHIETQYILPLTTAAHAEVIPLHPGNPGAEEILPLLRRSFTLPSDEPGYELYLRAILSEIWLKLLPLIPPPSAQNLRAERSSAQLKQMMIFVHEHYGERIGVADLARAACVSERTCHTLFQRHLHTTPTEYINSHRMRIARQMLTQTTEPVTAICTACALGSSSYFAVRFRRETGMTPLEYRQHHKLSNNKK